MPRALFSSPLRTVIVCGIILVLANRISCASLLWRNDIQQQVSTEPPENVELFNPQEWISKAAGAQQIQISHLKLETKVRLRFGRTRVSVTLSNPHTKPLQANFRIILPQDAFFTTFKLKRKNDLKLYSATVMKKKEARDLYHFAHVKTNGTVSSGFIELSNDYDLSTYNLKFTLGPGITLQAYLMYERQLERIDDIYNDMIHIFPIEKTVVRMVEISVEVEELESIKSLSCSSETEERYINCNRRQKPPKSPQNRAELMWRNLNVTADFMKNHPFEFYYELNQSNTPSAVVLAQSNGNLFFVHLFVPKHLPVMRKHIVFLLDVSDSMHGKKLEQLKWSMREILDDISSEDFLTIIPFSDNVTVWSPFQGERKKCALPIPVTYDYKSAAQKFVKDLAANGVTDIELAMLKAFELILWFSPETDDKCPDFQNINLPPKIRAKVPPKLPKNVESIIFFLSDGVPTAGLRNSNQLLEMFTSFNYNKLPKPAQIHTIAYGDAADVHFLKALSSQNGGSTKVITDESAAGIELTQFYLEISTNILSHIQTFVSINTTNNTFTQPQRVASHVVLMSGGEVITAGKILPQTNQTDLIKKPARDFHWNTQASSKAGSIQYTSEVYDCRSLRKSLPECLERIDFYLRRLQAYQLLQKLVIRDSIIQQGLICLKSYDEDVIYSDNLWNYDTVHDADEEGYMYDDDDQECVNPYKEKIMDIALKEGFVTPYTAFSLSTDPHIDIGLLGSWGKISEKQPNSEEATDTNNSRELNTQPEKLTEDEALVEPPLPINKLIRMNITNEVNSTSYNVTENNPPQKKVWLTKTIKDFVVNFFRKLKVKIDRKAGVPDTMNFNLGHPFR